jgi:hypothetical protein
MSRITIVTPYDVFVLEVIGIVAVRSRERSPNGTHRLHLQEERQGDRELGLPLHAGVLPASLVSAQSEGIQGDADHSVALFQSSLMNMITNGVFYMALFVYPNYFNVRSHEIINY